MKQFSTAANTGATSILIKALEDSKWFVPIERENIGNLLQEKSYSFHKTKYADPSVPQITPIIYGILLEGGIVSYDSNIMGGFGGLGILGRELSSRQGQVTIYQYGIFMQNGKTSNISKTILSQHRSESFNM
jgi:curli production assembly/transport component CsgG